MANIIALVHDDFNTIESVLEDLVIMHDYTQIHPTCLGKTDAENIVFFAKPRQVISMLEKTTEKIVMVSVGHFLFGRLSDLFDEIEVSKGYRAGKAILDVPYTELHDHTETLPKLLSEDNLRVCLVVHKETALIDFI